MRISLKLLFAIILVLACALAGVGAIYRWSQGDTEWARLKLPDASEVRITTENKIISGLEMEGNDRVVIYGQRFSDGDPQQGRYILGACERSAIENAEFATATSNDEDLVIVFERQNPDVILAFYELSTRTCFPKDRFSPLGDYYKKMNAILQKLRYENPGKNFVLSDLVPDSRDVLVR